MQNGEMGKQRNLLSTLSSFWGRRGTSSFQAYAQASNWVRSRRLLAKVVAVAVVVAEFEPGGCSAPERSELGLGGHRQVLNSRCRYIRFRKLLRTCVGAEAFGFPLHDLLRLCRGRLQDRQAPGAGWRIKTSSKGGDGRAFPSCIRY